MNAHQERRPLPRALSKVLRESSRDLRQLSLRRTRAEPDRLTPNQLLNRELPRALAERTDRLEGVMTLVLRGLAERAWTIDFAGRTVTPHRHEDADLVLVMEPADFMQLMKNRLDVDAAYRARRIQAHGDLEVLGTLALVLQEGAFERGTRST